MQFFNKMDMSNIMIMNFIYHQPNKANEYKDFLDVVYKNIKTGEKFVKTITCPTMDIYFAKEQYRDYDYIKTFLPLNQVDRHTVEYRNICFDIAKLAGPEHVNYVKECYKTGRRYEAKNMHQHPYVFGSDYDIENWYRIKFFLDHHVEHQMPITKSYLDIEVDGIDTPGFPRDGVCPINAVTWIDETDSTVYTFLLRNKDNPLIEEFENNIESFKNELHNDFDEYYGVLNYRLLMYDSEKEMLMDLFKLINLKKRDFLLIWNAGFDIPFIIARCDRLGIDATDMMCSSDFPIKDMYYKKDTKNFKVEYKGDYFKISSYTVYLDQMLIYAATRKGSSELRSHALNYVSQVELGDSKLDYGEVADIKTLPYVDYNLFVKYNIKDTLLQMGIERRTCDIDNVYQRCYYNATCYEKIFRQTVFLKSRAYLEYYQQGFIIGNNPNLIYGQNDTLADAPIIEEDDDDDEDDNVIKKETKVKFDGAVNHIAA